MGFSSDMMFREMVKTSSSEEGGLVLLGGSFAPGVVTEYRGLSSSRSAWALAPSSQLWYGMKLGRFPSKMSANTSPAPLVREFV